jgi:hypothetical protein
MPPVGVGPDTGGEFTLRLLIVERHATVRDGA